MIWLIGNRGMLGTEVEELLKTQGLNYIASDQEVDITNIDELQKYSEQKPISWIINCAAYTAVDKAEDEPDLAFKLNAAGPLNIAKTTKTKNAKLIHISTDYVFDGAKKDAYTEKDTPNPINIYGASKYQGERNIRETIEEYFILRTSWLYGKNGNNFVHTMLRLFKKQDEVRIVNDQWGSPTYAVDLAKMIVEIINRNSDQYGMYNFTNEGSTNWYEYANHILRLAQSNGLTTSKNSIIPITTEQYPTKAKRPHNSRLSKKVITGTFAFDIRKWDIALEEYFSNVFNEKDNKR